jgi:hypothetical protein
MKNIKIPSRELDSLMESWIPRDDWRL